MVICRTGGLNNSMYLLCEELPAAEASLFLPPSCSLLFTFPETEFTSLETVPLESIVILEGNEILLFPDIVEILSSISVLFD